MDRIKDLLNVVFGGRLAVEGTGRTFARVPVWLAVLAAAASLRLALVTALLAVAFGLHARVEGR